MGVGVNKFGNMKRLFFVSLAIFITTTLFLGVYTLVFRNERKNPTVDEARQEEAKEEEEILFESGLASGGAVEPVSDLPAYGPAIVGENAIASFYGGALRQFSFGGGGEQIIIENLPGKVGEVRWAPDRHAALGNFETPEGWRWYLVEIGNASVTPLKKGIIAPTWSNLSERIFYFYDDGKKTGFSLTSAKPDGSDWKEIARVPALRTPYTETVPESAMLSFWDRPSAFEEASLYTIPAVGGTPKLIFSGKFGADFRWSPSGDHLLISNTIGKGGSDVRLGIANQQGGEFHTLQAPTIVSKTAWSKDGKTIYYALPLSLPENVVLPDDYYRKPLLTSDSFWKMNTETGRSERLVPPDEITGDFDSIDLFLDGEEEYLFFTNRRDDRLYRIPLR